MLRNIKHYIKVHLGEDKVERLSSYSPLMLLQNERARRNYNKLKRRKIICDTINVGFLVQMPEIWDKQLPLFRALIENKNFSVILIVVPEYNYEKKTIREDYQNNYFIQNYKENVVMAYNNNEWISIEKLSLDYLFYQRPYDWYLPETLQSSQVSKTTKCCYIPYAFWPLRHDLCGYNRAFYRNLYFAFMESKENCQEIIKRGDYASKERYLFCGYPSLEKTGIENVGYNQGPLSVLWTPRWIYDKRIGGSHFFEYKDLMLDLPRIIPNLKLIMRPHPLAFQNYIAQGKMTIEEVDKYIDSVESKGGSFDSNRIIEDTFRSVDILITDISSIVFTFILTEKPIIFCDTMVPKSPAFEKIMKGMYVAHEWNDIVRFVDLIKKGEDPLEKVRHNIAQQIRDDNMNATNNIIYHLINE